MRYKLMAAALLVTAVACSARSDDAAIPPADLAGSWVLNLSESTDTSAFRAPPDSARRPRPNPGTRPTNDWPSGSGGIGRVDRPSFTREALDLALELMRYPVEGFTIQQEPGQITLVRDSARSVVLRTDGKPVKLKWLDGREVYARAKWVDGRLRIERDLDEGVTAVDHYSRGTASPRLIVFTVLEGPLPRDFTARWVYDSGNTSAR